jgi:aminoglycoside phosphotransferase (APT) family kinase protein
LLSTSESDSARLAGWLAGAGGPSRVTRWTPLGGGRSATSVLVTLDDSGAALDAVLHIEANEGPLLGVTSAARQFDLLRSLGSTPVRSPEPLWFVPAEVLGRPAYLTRFEPGEVPDPWSRSGSAFLSRQPPGGPLARDLLRCLADIHAVGLERVADAARRDAESDRDHPAREHERWSAVLAASPVFSRDPLLGYADAWLSSHRPSVSERALVHGDYRIGNVVIEGDRIASVLDWELAEVGDPRYDIATLCSPPLRVNGLACGLWEPSALVACYEEMTGRHVDRDALSFYSVLAAFKVACLWVNASLPFSAGDGDLPALRAGYSVMQCRPMLAEALGLEPPTAQRESNRALDTVRAALRETAARLGGEDRININLAVAVLREWAQPAVPLRDSFQEDVTALARDVGLDACGERLGDTLIRTARRILSDPGEAHDPGRPLHRRARALVAESAGVVAWP